VTPAAAFHRISSVVFEEFVQLEKPARDRTQGLGLGLAIVRRTAELLEHPLRLVSTPGRGSTFSIDVPKAHAPEAPNLTAGAATAGHPIGIMVVEDERDVLDAMTQLLALDGHRVYAGQTAAEVQEIYSSHLREGELAGNLRSTSSLPTTVSVTALRVWRRSGVFAPISGGQFQPSSSPGIHRRPG
jgi:hypothetical protein